MILILQRIFDSYFLNDIITAYLEKNIIKQYFIICNIRIITKQY